MDKKVKEMLISLWSYEMSIKNSIESGKDIVSKDSADTIDKLSAEALRIFKEDKKIDIFNKIQGASLAFKQKTNLAESLALIEEAIQEIDKSIEEEERDESGH